MLNYTQGLRWKLALVVALSAPVAFTQEQEPAQPSQPQVTLGLKSLSKPAAPPQNETGSANTSSPAASAPSQNRLLNYRVQVAGKEQWTDTKIDLVPGDRVEFTSTGNVTFMGKNCSPEGLARGWADLVKSLPVNDAGNCTLIGRIGDPDHAVPFAIGSKKQVDVRSAGRLYLGVNQTSRDTTTGEYEVAVSIVPAKETGPAATTKTVLDPKLFTQIPRRVVDQQGNEGDAVNFLIIGPKQQLEAAFREAGWVVADRDVKDAVFNAALKSTTKQVYLEMPMSQLYMFHRPQDYGYARTEPVQVVASRHHLRIWKSPFEVDGQPLWVGACTHDIGFERDQRNNGVTHKIDPEIDKEREYLAGTLNATGLIAESSYTMPPNPITEASTATGGSFHSDGRILVLRLGPQ